MSGRATNLAKNNTYDRILKLRLIEGLTATSTSGSVDKRLFKDENSLHAKMDLEYGHWYVQYEKGTVPPSLQQRWTSFSKMLQYVTEYYKRRNVEIAEITDA